MDTDNTKKTNKLVSKLRNFRMNLQAKISELESYGIDTTQLKKANSITTTTAAPVYNLHLQQAPDLRSA